MTREEYDETVAIVAAITIPITLFMYRALDPVAATSPIGRGAFALGIITILWTSFVTHMNTCNEKSRYKLQQQRNH